MTALHKYLENTRHYHDFTHIGHIFEDLREFFPEYNRNKVLKFAALYHDCFYLAGNENNEFVSASSAHVEAEEAGFAIGQRDEVYRLIMLTKKHETVSGDNLGKVMIDLDLWRLGSKEYEENSRLIRKEFSGTDDDWRKGRVAWLESFLSRPAIYLSAQGHPFQEKSARLNMEAELAYLKGLS